jgi:hypothetical protein
MVHLIAELTHHLGKKVPFGGGHEFDPQPFRVQADMFEESFAEKSHGEGMVIPMGDVIAFVEAAPSDKHSVHPIGEGPEHEFQVHPAGTHDADQSHFRGILQSGNSSHVTCAVCSPVAHEADDPRLKFEFGSHSFSPL